MSINEKIKSAFFTNSLKDITISNITCTFKFISNSYFLPKISRFINDYFYKLPLWGIGSAVNRYSNSFCIYSASEDKKLYQDYLRDALFLNIGSGGFYHKKWLNFDLPGVSKYYKNLQGKKNKNFKPFDLSNEKDQLNIQNDSVDLIYISHVLDHLETEDILSRFIEFRKILKPGGLIRIVLPDTDKNISISEFLNNQPNLNSKYKKISASESIRNSITDSINFDDEELYKLACNKEFIMEEIEKSLILKNSSVNKIDVENPQRRITYLNHEKLKKLAIKAGFSAYYPTIRGQSFAKPFLNLNIFDVTEPHLSMYSELIK